MVIQDLRSGGVSRYWRDDLSEMRTPPFETGEDVAIVSYFAPAEVQSMLALDWDIDVSVIDLFAEFRCQTNGNPERWSEITGQCSTALWAGAIYP